MKQTPERDPCLVAGWGEDRLRNIITKQRAAAAKAKRLNLNKPLQQIMNVIGGMTDRTDVDKDYLLSQIYICGRHDG